MDHGEYLVRPEHPGTSSESQVTKDAQFDELHDVQHSEARNSSA